MNRMCIGSLAAAGAVVVLMSSIGLVVGPLLAQSAISADGRIESTTGGFVFPDGTLQTTAAAAGAAPVEDTGLQGCWDAAGTSISCAGTGQDGAFQPVVGVDWPAPRFTDNLDGTVTDNLTGLIWLEDANCFGLRNWTDALTETNGLMNGDCSLSDGSAAADWRLPSIKELLTLVDYSQWNPVLPSGHPFDNVQSASYWSSSTGPDLSRDGAWFVELSAGYNSISPSKGSLRSVWPVRGGR